MGGFIQYKHGCVRSVAAGRCAKEAQRDLVPGSAFPTPTLQLLRDIYLPSNQVLELLDLFVGLRVLLQVPLGEEGLVGRESLSPPTCPTRRQFGTSGVPQAWGESCVERRPTALPSPGSHPPRVGPSLPKHSGRSIQQKDSVHSLRRPRPQSPGRLLLTPAPPLLRSWAALPSCDHQPGLLRT